MDFQKINDVYKIILDKCELDKSWRWMSPDTLEAFDWLIDEINEAKEEYNNKKQVYLEDELWDIFWDYMCLLQSLEQEKMINSKKVFERCYKKFSERLWADWDGVSWQEIKKKQKEELKTEHNLKYNN